MKQLYYLLALILFSVNIYSQKETDTNQEYQNLFLKGESLAEGGKLKEAITAFTDAIKIYPAKPDAYFGRGMTYFADSSFENAINDFTKLLELNYSNSGEIYFMRGVSKMQLKIEAEGCADLKKSKELKYDIDWEMFKNICPD